MAFKIICEFCESQGEEVHNCSIEFEKESIFIVCNNCGQEREIIE
jgi:transcription elongation factor Elf1